MVRRPINVSEKSRQRKFYADDATFTKLQEHAASVDLNLSTYLVTRGLKAIPRSASTDIQKIQILRQNFEILLEIAETIERSSDGIDCFRCLLQLEAIEKRLLDLLPHYPATPLQDENTSEVEADT